MSDLNLSLIGNNFRLIRERLYHLSQAETARLCQSSRSTIRRVEDGEQAPSLDLIQRFGRLDERFIFSTDNLVNRDFSHFSIHTLHDAGVYNRKLAQVSDDFIGAWYDKISAELRLFGLAMEREKDIHE